MGGRGDVCVAHVPCDVVPPRWRHRQRAVVTSPRRHHPGHEATTMWPSPPRYHHGLPATNVPPPPCSLCRRDRAATGSQRTRITHITAPMRRGPTAPTARPAPLHRSGCSTVWQSLPQCIVRAYGPSGRRMRRPYGGLGRGVMEVAWRWDVTDGAWGTVCRMAYGVGVWRRWAKRAKAWSSLRSIWLMLEAEKLYPTASFRAHPRCAHFLITHGLLHLRGRVMVVEGHGAEAVAKLGRARFVRPIHPKKSAQGTDSAGGTFFEARVFGGSATASATYPYDNSTRPYDRTRSLGRTSEASAPSSRLLASLVALKEHGGESTVAVPRYP